MAVVCNVGTLTQPSPVRQYQAGAPRPIQLFSHTNQEDQHRTAISEYNSTTGWGWRIADRTIGLNPGAAISTITSVAGSSLFTVGGSTTPLVSRPRRLRLIRSLRSMVSTPPSQRTLSVAT